MVTETLKKTTPKIPTQGVSLLRANISAQFFKTASNLPSFQRPSQINLQTTYLCKFVLTFALLRQYAKNTTQHSFCRPPLLSAHFTDDEPKRAENLAEGAPQGLLREGDQFVMTPKDWLVTLAYTTSN